MKVGDRVNILDQTKTQKNQATYIGPFIITQITEDNKYNLIDCSNLSGPVSYNVPISHMKLESKANSNVLPNNSDDIYYVEAIIDHKDVLGSRKYLGKWDGYSSSENTWEPASHILNDKLIKDYWIAHDKEIKASAKNIDNTKRNKSGKLISTGKK